MNNLVVWSMIRVLRTELKGVALEFSALHPILRHDPLILGGPPKLSGAPLTVAGHPLLLGPPRDYPPASNTYVIRVYPTNISGLAPRQHPAKVSGVPVIIAAPFRGLSR